MRFKPSPVVALYTLLILTALTYSSLYRAPPLNWDDDSNIFANPFFLHGYPGEFWREPYFGLYVPVTSTVWYALFLIGGGAATPFRLLNAGAHVVNVFLVYKLILSLGRRRGWPAAWPAVAGAAVFALHPLQVQAVAWISGGRDLLATTFGLAAFGLYLRGGRRNRVLATAAYAASLLSKPSLVTLPLITWTLAPLADETGPTGARRRGWPWLAGWVGLAGVVTWWTLSAQAGHLPDVAWWRRPWLMGDSLWFYGTRALNLYSLGVNYARTPAVVFANPGTLVGAGVALVAFVIISFRKRFRTWAPFARATGWALLPVSGVVSFGYQNISGVADHYAYPLLAIGATAFATALANTPPARRGAAVAGTLALLGWLTWTTWTRLSTWSSNAALFTDMVRTAPNAYSTALGMSNVACGERGDYAAGILWTDVALRERPLDVRALANRAYCYLHDHQTDRVVDLGRDLGRLDRARAARTEPTGYASLLASIGTARIERGAYADGYALLCEAARVLPTAAIHRQNLAAATDILRAHHVEPACAPTP